MPRANPPNLCRQRTRHGKIVWYFRRGKEPRVRLRAEYNTPAFWAEYRAALEGAPVLKVDAAPKFSIRWAIDRYRESSAWSQLANATRRQRENIFREVCERIGHEPLKDMRRSSIIASRDRRKDKPHAANNYLKAMRGFCAWCAGDGGLLKEDPTTGVTLLRGKNDEAGFHAWTEEEVARFEAHWPLGTRERLAFDILLYTGLRRGDAVRLGPAHIVDGEFTIVMEKTGEEVSLPLLGPLKASIAAGPVGRTTFIATQKGDPRVKESFGNWFKQACVAAGVLKGNAHGLRKAGATRAAEASASEMELMSMYGWQSGKMAAIYTRKARRRKMARGAASKLLLPEKSSL